MNMHLAWVFACVLLCGSAKLDQAQDTAGGSAGKPLIWTGVTGSITASGLDDPHYVLSFLPVQRLMLEALWHEIACGKRILCESAGPGEPL
jgi:hypothetical protein